LKERKYILWTSVETEEQNIMKIVFVII